MRGGLWNRFSDLSTCSARRLLEEYEGTSKAPMVWTASCVVVSVHSRDGEERMSCGFVTLEIPKPVLAFAALGPTGA